MKTSVVFVAFLLLGTAPAQSPDEGPPRGVIYGNALDYDGQPAKGVGLTACPLGVALGGILPHTKTNDAGEYRFESIPWWGRYTVYGDDEDAGYSYFSTGWVDSSHPPEVELNPERQEAEFTVHLPQKAGFLHIQLTNRRTGTGISDLQVELRSVEHPESQLFSMRCASDRVILIPPDKDFLLHVTSEGFREWDEGAEKGKPIPLDSGTRQTLDVQLEPSD